MTSFEFFIYYYTETISTELNNHLTIFLMKKDKKKISKKYSLILCLSLTMTFIFSLSYAQQAPDNSHSAIGLPEIIRINVGGQDYTDNQNILWKADQYFQNGVVRAKTFNVLETENDHLYLSYRFANHHEQGFSYQIPVQKVGLYQVRLHFVEPFFGAPGGQPVGDSKRIFKVQAEGKKLLEDFEIFREVGATKALVKNFNYVAVKDGLLNLNFTSQKDNAIISAIEVTYKSPLDRPYVIEVHGAENNVITQSKHNVVLDENFSTELFLLDVALDRATIDENSVQLLEVKNQSLIKVDVRVNSTGGGDAITLVPKKLLNPFTAYQLIFSSRIKDLKGRSLLADTLHFTTGDQISCSILEGVEFEKIMQEASKGSIYTSLCTGPDNKLYATTLDGFIKRFEIARDGTLQNPETLDALRKHRRLPQVDSDDKILIGFTFDPNASADNLIAWVSYSGHFEANGRGDLRNGPAWDGNIARLSGTNLEQVEDIVVNLPRSVKDHLTNSVAFGPDQALYFTQGSNTAMGRADGAWGNRPERLLSAAVLRLDVPKLNVLAPKLPINAKTEGNNAYDPFNAKAPLTLYATGVRNAYDLVWHSNGDLLVPNNGSAMGGNTPTSNPDSPLYKPPHPKIPTYQGPKNIPALTKVEPTQNDWLYNIKPGRYYGHPNSLRAEYVLNRGEVDVLDSAYIGIHPSESFHQEGLLFNFKNNKSPGGVIEYQSRAFGEKLKGMLMVTRYSQQDDLILLKLSQEGGIAEVYDGSCLGLDNFADPLDIVEDTRTGNLYVSEAKTKQISLLKVKGDPKMALENRDSIPANDELSFCLIQQPWKGWRHNTPSNENHDRVSLRIHNQGKGILFIDKLELSNVEYWEIEQVQGKAFDKSSSLSLNINPGDFADIQVHFIARNPTAQSARDSLVQVLHETLTIYSNDIENPKKVIKLHGLWQKQGEGSREPLLQDILETMGWTTKTGFELRKTGNLTNPTGDEIITRLFEAVDPTQAVYLRQIAAYHGCCAQPETIRYQDLEPYERLGLKPALKHIAVDAQSLLPRADKQVKDGIWGNPAEAYLRPQGQFSLNVNRSSLNFYLNFPSADEPDKPGWIAFRVYPLINSQGTVVPNTYILAQDYVKKGANYDYNDNIYLISNVKPLPVEPSDTSTE